MALAPAHSTSICRPIGLRFKGGHVVNATAVAVNALGALTHRPNDRGGGALTFVWRNMKIFYVQKALKSKAWAMFFKAQGFNL